MEDFSVPQFKAKYMGNSTYLMAQMPFNFMFEFKDYEENATNINDSIQSYLRTLPASGVPNWAVSIFKEEKSRSSNRLRLRLEIIFLFFPFFCDFAPFIEP